MLLARVTIGDFDRFWTQFTSAGAEQRRKYGSSGATVFRNLDRPDEVLALFDWAKDDYLRFMDDPRTREIMQAAGLTGPPETIEVEQVGEVAS